MNIGLLALGFGILCGILSLMSAAQAERPRRPAKDYRRVYEAVSPKEL